MKIREMEGARELTALRQLNEMRRERDVLFRELSRMYERREVLKERKVLDEARRKRFLKRLEAEIRQAQDRAELLEANIAGMESV